MRDDVVSILNLCKGYNSGENRIEILRNLNFSVKQGETVAIIGPSGSGKTSLLQIIGLLDDYDSGSLEIDGKICNDIPDNDASLIRRTKIGYVYQFHHLMPEFTVLENVMMPLLISGISEKTALSKAKQMLEFLSIDHRKDHKPSEISGGEQQRAAIARSLVVNPILLLADEPTGNLDTKSAELFMELLHKIAQETDIAIIVVTHNLTLAKRFGRIVKIENGSIIEMSS